MDAAPCAAVALPSPAPPIAHMAMVVVAWAERADGVGGPISGPAGTALSGCRTAGQFKLTPLDEPRAYPELGGQH